MSWNEHIQSLRDNKFVKDSVWLGASFLLLGVCGIAINVVIAYFLGADALGRFNLSLKIFLIASLIATIGSHSSMVLYAAHHEAKSKALNDSLLAAMTIGLMGSLLVTCLGLWLAPLANELFNVGRIDRILYGFFAAIPLFTQSKILMGLLNGQREIKAYAMIQSLRWVLLSVLIGLFVWYLPLHFVGWAFAITEFIILVVALIRVRKLVRFALRYSDEWVLKHLNFGYKSIMSNVIIDLYTYSDIFIIGVFMNAGAVGLYSFASDIAKNFHAFTNVIQTNLNPVMANLWKQGKTDQLKLQMRRVRNTTYRLYMPLIPLAAVMYWWAAPYFKDGMFNDSVIPFLVLIIGFGIISGLRPLFSVLEMSGFPADRLRINVIALVLNIGLSLFMVQWWGIFGVALATALTYVISALILNQYARARLKINIFNL